MPAVLFTVDFKIMINRTKKNIFYTILCIILTVLFVTISGNILAPTDNDTAISRTQIQTFHALPENSIDVISFGSSHNWRGMNMQPFIDNGISAYNYGNNWQHINTTQQFLYDALKTQSPKIVLIESVNAYKLLQEMDMEGEIFYTRNLKPDIHRIEYLHQCFGSYLKPFRYFSYVFPVLTFHSNWENITTDNFKRNPGDCNFLESHGSVLIQDAMPLPFEWNGECPDQFEFDSRPLEILTDIAKTCNENNITLIFYTSPGFDEYHYTDAIQRFADEHNCLYVSKDEIWKATGINGEIDFSDYSHLNASGATKVGKYLSEIVKKYL